MLLWEIDYFRLRHKKITFSYFIKAGSYLKDPDKSEHPDQDAHMQYDQGLHLYIVREC